MCANTIENGGRTAAGMRDGGVQQSGGVVEGHRLDVEGAQDRFFVDEVAVFAGRVASGEDDAHVAQVDMDSAQIGTIQRRTLYSI